MRLGVVIQARMGSTRLPGKVLKQIAGRPLLDHVVGRLELLRHEGQPVVATGEGAGNAPIVERCQALGVTIFQGSETDVLDRYVSCALAFGFDHVVRLTADNPFTDMEELDRLLDLHFMAGNDYTHSFGVMPLGIGAEVFTTEALVRSGRDGHAPNHREHVNEYVQENPHLFKVGRLEVPAAKSRPDLSMTVDTPDDYLRACRIAGQASSKWISTQEAIAAC